MPTPDISVIVPTYARSDELMRLLRSLDQLSGAPPFEVIVVDDASPDDTEARLAAWAKRPHTFDARYLRQPRNQGPAIARNTGLAEARGRLVAFTDSDVSVHREWLHHLPKQVAPDNGIAGAGGKVLPMDRFGLISRWSTMSRILEPRPPQAFLVTCNCIYDKALLLEVGGFEEAIPTPGGEDVAPGILLWDKGYAFAYEPAAIVYHDYREDRRNFCRTWRNYGYGVSYVTQKYLPQLTRDAEGADYDWRDIPIQSEPLLAGMRLQIVGGLRKAWREPHLLGQELGFMWIKLLNLWYWRVGWREAERDYRKATATDVHR